jgi:membrane associated rhomboid family serine protease
MQNLVLVIAAIAGFAAVRLLRGRRRHDLPLAVLLVALAATGGASAAFDFTEAGLAVVAVGLLIGIVPPYLAMAAQLARVQGRHLRVSILETLAWVLQPSAVRRLHRGAASVVSAVGRGRCAPGEAMGRLRSLDRILPPLGATLLVEAARTIHADAGDWASALGGLPEDLRSPDALDGLTLGARDAIVRALLATDRTEEAAAVVQGMELSLVQERPFLAAPGDLAELPEAWLDRSRLRLAAALGADMGPLLARPSVLRALVPATVRRTTERAAALVRGAGRSPDVRALADRVAALLGRSARLPSFLTSLRAPAPAVTFVAALNALLLVPVLWSGSSLDATHLLAVGGAFPSLVRGAEPWRLVTSMWLHAGLVHLALNVLFLLHAGNMVERLSGPRRFLAVYLVSGLAGGVAAAFIGEPQVLVGASGAISGIFAAGGWRLYSLRHDLPARWYRRNFSAYTQTFVANVLLGFALPVVSMSAHGGGFAVGLLTAILLDRLPSRASSRRLGAVVVGVAWAASLAWGAAGLVRTWQRPLSEVVPVKAVVVPIAGPKARGTARLALPVTWADLDAAETASGHQAWVGYSGQLAAVSVTCGAGWTREIDGREVEVQPGDAAALAAVVADLIDDSGAVEIRPGVNGFALIRRATAGGGTAIAAHRMFPAGVLHLDLFFDADGQDEALLPAILAGADLVECETL